MKNLKRISIALLVLIGLGGAVTTKSHIEMNKRIRAETDKAIHESCKRDPSVNCPPTKELLDAAYTRFYAEVKQQMESRNE